MFSSPYVPLTIVPVSGIASCRRVFVDTLSCDPNGLKIVIVYPYNFANATGMSTENPVVSPVTRTIESITFTVGLLPPP